MMRGSWAPPLRGHELALAVLIHIGVWTAIVLPVCFIATADMGWPRFFITVPVSFLALWFGKWVAARIVWARSHARLARSLRREQG